MNTQQLNDYLYRITDSERRHQARAPQTLSEKYDSIAKTNYKGREVFQFRFDSLMQDSNIAVNKESRFTYIPDHVHTVIEILYVYAGSCTQIIDGRKVAMEQGDLCLLDSDVLHGIEYMGADDIVISIVMRKDYFTNGILSRLGEKGIINAFLANSLSKNQEHNQYLLFRKISAVSQNTLANLLCEYYDKTLCSNQMIDAYVIILFCELLRQFHDMTTVQRTEREDPIIPILTYIEHHYMDISLKSAAKAFGFHPNYFSTLVHSGTGYTFKDLVILEKLSIACFALKNTQEPIYEIAQRVGYNNLGFFYRKFKEYYKLTPQEYRNAYHQQ